MNQDVRRNVLLILFLLIVQATACNAITIWLYPNESGFATITTIQEINQITNDKDVEVNISIDTYAVYSNVTNIGFNVLINDGFTSKNKTIMDFSITACSTLNSTKEYCEPIEISAEETYANYFRISANVPLGKTEYKARETHITMTYVIKNGIADIDLTPIYEYGYTFSCNGENCPQGIFNFKSIRLPNDRQIIAAPENSKTDIYDNGTIREIKHGYVDTALVKYSNPIETEVYIPLRSALIGAILGAIIAILIAPIYRIIEKILSINKNDYLVPIFIGLMTLLFCWFLLNISISKNDDSTILTVACLVGFSAIYFYCLRALDDNEKHTKEKEKQSNEQFIEKIVEHNTNLNITELRKQNQETKMMIESINKKVTQIQNKLKKKTNRKKKD